jgi:AcrR family transcriptional regulator
VSRQRSQPVAEVDTKGRILDAVWKLVSRRGRADMTMGDIARAVGLSRQAVYLHFPSRAALLVAAVRRFDEQHGDPAARDRRRALPPVASFEAGIRAWMAYLPQVLTVAGALEAAAIVGEEGADAWQDRMRYLREGERFYIARLAEHGLLADGWTVDDALDWMWARTHPSVWRHLVVEQGWDREKFVDRLVRSLVAELVAPPAARRKASRRGRRGRR